MVFMRGLPGMPDQWNAGKSLCGGRGLKVKFGDGRGGKYLNMKYWELLKEENEAVAERHELAMERIGHMKEEATVGEPYRAFFERTVQFIELIEETFQKQMDGTLAAIDSDQLWHECKPAGVIYQATLRRETTRSLGLEFGPVDRPNPCVIHT